MLKRHFTFLSKGFQVFRIGEQKGDDKELGRIGIDANIVHQGTRFELRLDFAQRHVFAELQFDQILFPVDNLYSPCHIGL